MIERNNIKKLNSFLLFGFFIDYINQNFKFDFSRIDKKKFLSFSEEELIHKGSELWDVAINKSFQNAKACVVPLSGGLDSRAILGGLLNCTEATNIYTYTFGTPGSLDFEIGNFIAKKIGTRHIEFPLTQHLYSLDEELEYSKRINHQTILFHHPPIFHILNSFSDYQVWSGFMGDPLTGSHLDKKPSIIYEDAISKFLQKNIYCKSINLVDKDLALSIIKEYLDIDENLNKKKIMLDDFLDFNYRQLRYIEPHVLMKGLKYITPFTDNDLFDFYLSIPKKYRYDQYLYKKILMNSYSKLFSYKTKNNAGLPLQANKFLSYTYQYLKKIKKTTRLFINPDINYIDFNDGIRYRADLKKIIYESIMDLKQRRIIDTLNIDKIWYNHINKRSNHADALITLASLEIHLKAGAKL